MKGVVPRIVVVEPPSAKRGQRVATLQEAGLDAVACHPVRTENLDLATKVVLLRNEPGPDTAFLKAARQSGRVVVVASEDSGVVTAVRQALENIEDADALDRLQRQLGDAFAGFIQLFLDESWQRERSMHAALERHDAATVGREAHTLKPTLGLLGAAKLSAQCAQIEATCRAGWDGTLPGSCKELLNGLAALREQLEPMHNGPLHA